MPTQRIQHIFAVAAGVSLLSLSPALLFAGSFSQTNLVSNVPGLARVTDSNLINPWGVASSAAGPFWISDQGTGLSTLYTGTGAPSALVVTIPGGTGDTAGPTGQVFNSTTGFVLPEATPKPASFLFANLNGTISGWNGGEGTTAATVITTPGASYTGLALASSGGNSYLYATDVNGTIHVFNSAFAPVALAGSFTDPGIPSGYFPYNIQLIGSQLYVTYATFDSSGNELPGGYVDAFNTDGSFAERIASGSPLFGPWGIALAPASFGDFGNDFLVGNVGDGEITAFSPGGLFLGTLNNPDGTPIVDQSIWALDFRTGGAGVDPNALYITAGINGESGGLFAAIAPTPEPTPLLLVGIGLVTLAALRLRQPTHLERV